MFLSRATAVLCAVVVDYGGGGIKSIDYITAAVQESTAAVDWL